MHPGGGKTASLPATGRGVAGREENPDGFSLGGVNPREKGGDDRGLALASGGENRGMGLGFYKSHMPREVCFQTKRKLSERKNGGAN